jgi:hypothetical protein
MNTDMNCGHTVKPLQFSNSKVIFITKSVTTKMTDCDSRSSRESIYCLHDAKFVVHACVLFFLFLLLTIYC